MPTHRTTATDAATIHRLDGDPVLPDRGMGFPLRAIAGQEMTVVHAEIPEGASLPLHSHPQEQFTYVVAGRLRFWQAGRPAADLTAGTVIHVPSDVSHGSEALENCVVMDVFHPGRHDLLT